MSEPLSILIIDDSEDDRMMLRRNMQKIAGATYVLFEAEDGETGLKHVETHTPACVLLDYSMPGHNGLDILKRIRAVYPFMPVVMMTGQGNEIVAVTAMQQGAQHYISKSSQSPEALEQVIRAAIEHCMLEKRVHEQRTSLEIFTRALAHDLKEPVRTVRSFAELIAQNETLPEKTQSHLLRIQNAAERMQMLIDTVFFYTRLDDPAQLAREVCNTKVVLEEVKENVGRLIAERDATIEADSLPEVNANRTQLAQLFQNLICNAIHHSEKPATIRISAEKQAAQWLFRVEDNGPGIEEGQFQKIFEPFKRLGRGGEHGGAGLGLAICKRIVELHHGRIWCESAPGRGATFLFTLPDELPPATQKVAETAATQLPAKPARKGGTELANVLLVDDSTADIEITRFRLIDKPPLRCNLLVASDGKEALSKLEDCTKGRQSIDLLLLDINMPSMDGFEVLEQIRRTPSLKEMAVVMCTGSTYDKDMTRARALGAVGYITKPVEFRQLLSVIQDTPGIQLQEGKEGYLLLRAA